jgi:hypothetical protein
MRKVTGNAVDRLREPNSDVLVENGLGFELFLLAYTSLTH